MTPNTNISLRSFAISGLFLFFALCFFALATSIRNEPLALDSWASSFLSQPESPVGFQILVDHFWTQVTALGSGALVVLFGVLVLGYLVLAHRWKTALTIGLCILAASLSAFLLKGIFERERPASLVHMIGADVYSFPSGHSVSSATVYLILAALVARVVQGRRLKIYAMLSGTLVMLLVGLSRVYLGVHYATDVLAGWLVGLSWALFSWVLLSRLQREGIVEQQPVLVEEDDAQPVSPPVGRGMRDSGTKGVLLLLVLLLLCSCSCGRQGEYKAPSIARSKPAKICVEPKATPCLPASRVEELISSPRLEILESTETPGGMQGGNLLTLRADGTVFRAKWRLHGGDASPFAVTSEPRRSAVAYYTQKLIFDEDEIVIPPTSQYCFPLRHFRQMVDEEAEADDQNGQCVLGYLSYWLPDIETVAEAEVGAREDKGVFSVENLFSEERFASDKLYARKVSRLNVLTFLIDHDDSHGGQFLVSRDPFHLWSIDHSMSLTSIKNPMVLFKEDWSQLKVPAIPADLADRVAQLERSDVEKLKRIQGFRYEHLVAEAGSDQSGTVTNWGATEAERELIWGRIEQLQSKLKSGELGKTPIGLE